MEKLIIYGGSFDPIHNGHLRMARGASLILNADVVFVPSAKPRWKEVSTNKDDRLSMLKIALKESGLTNFSISDYEMKKHEDINYTIDTVKHFKKEYPNRKLYLLIGADQVAKFHEWKDAKTISELANIVYVRRDGVDENIENAKKYSMMRLDIKQIGSVSSTKIRNLQSVDTPSSVITYIEKNNLYYMEKIKTFIPKERIDHSLEVAHLAALICRTNQLGAEMTGKAYIAGLLHDIGKFDDKERIKKIMVESFKEYLDMPSFSYHQFVGSLIANRQFGIIDEEILDAIKFHATGKKYMSMLGKIIYSSDKIEPTRGYDSSFLINACLENAETGFLKVLEANKKHLLDNKKDIYNRLTKECMDLYLGR